jgi:hypothetical protein
MRSDSRALFWPATLQPPCFGREPKVKVATRFHVLKNYHGSIGVKVQNDNILGNFLIVRWHILINYKLETKIHERFG